MIFYNFITYFLCIPMFLMSRWLHYPKMLNVCYRFVLKEILKTSFFLQVLCSEIGFKDFQFLNFPKNCIFLLWYSFAYRFQTFVICFQWWKSLRKINLFCFTAKAISVTEYFYNVFEFLFFNLNSITFRIPYFSKDLFNFSLS